MTSSAKEAEVSQSQSAFRNPGLSWNSYFNPVAFQAAYWVQEHQHPAYQQGAVQPLRRPAGNTHKGYLGDA